MLTGKVRTRKSWLFGRLIMQVEVKCGFTDKLTCKSAYRWKDASDADLQWLVDHLQYPSALLPPTRQPMPVARPDGFKPRIVK